MPRLGRVRLVLAALVLLLGALITIEALGTNHDTVPAVTVPRFPPPEARAVRQVDSPAARLLALRHHPIVMIRQRDEICGGDGEPYLPMPVDIVFDNPAVRLRENSGRSDFRAPVLVTAPSIADLADADLTTYLDFPGDPRNPRCSYELWYRASMVGHEPTVYARVIESDDSHVAVQYHLFYVFNDFNNNHEGDWETIQVLYEAPDVVTALRSAPVEVAYGQHAGGERAGWDSGKLRREGTRPVVYIAQGSHASYFGPGVFLGWGDNGSGFGCDSTLLPTREVEVRVEMVPMPALLTGEAPGWVDWPGRWGERQSWEYDGARAPQRTKRWRDPVGWHEDRLRDSSIEIPGTALLGPAPADVFCDVTNYGSIVLMRFVGEPWYFLTVLAAPVTVVGVLLWLSWATLLAALRVYLRYLPAFALLGLLLIPIGMLTNGAYALVMRQSPIRDLLVMMELTPVAYYVAAMPISSLQQVISLLIVAPGVLEVFRAIERREPITARRMVRGVHRHFVPMVRANLKPLAKVVLAQLTVIGLPWAIERAVRWGFVAQAVVLDEAAPGEAPMRSAEAVRGRWWWTAATILALAVIGAAPGPVLGIVLMVTESAGVDFVNTLSSLIYAVALPFSVLGAAVLYRQRQAQTPATGRDGTIPATTEHAAS